MGHSKANMSDHSKDTDFGHPKYHVLKWLHFDEIYIIMKRKPHICTLFKHVRGYIKCASKAKKVPLTDRPQYYLVACLAFGLVETRTQLMHSKGLSVSHRTLGQT